MTATTLETTVTTAPRRGAGRGRERAVRAALLACTVVGLAVLAALLLDVAVAGVPRLDLDFLSSYPSRHPEATGILPGLTGTLSLLVLVVALAVPVGIGAALYLEELAPPAATGWSARLARVAELNIANLAGVPSVVFGLLGSTLFVYWLGFGRNLLAGAATLALLVLPVVIVAPCTARQRRRACRCTARRPRSRRPPGGHDRPPRSASPRPGSTGRCTTPPSCSPTPRHLRCWSTATSTRRRCSSTATAPASWTSTPSPSAKLRSTSPTSSSTSTSASPSAFPPNGAGPSPTPSSTPTSRRPARSPASPPTPPPPASAWPASMRSGPRRWPALLGSSSMPPMPPTARAWSVNPLPLVGGRLHPRCSGHPRPRCADPRSALARIQGAAPRIAFALGKPPRQSSVVFDLLRLLRERDIHVAVRLPHDHAGAAPAWFLDVDLIVQRGLDPQALQALTHLEEAGIRCCNSIAATGALADRMLLAPRLHAARVPVPPTRPAATWADARAVADDRPVVVKARDGRRGRGVHVVASADGRLPPAAPFDGPYIVQDRLRGDGSDRKLYVAGGHLRGLLKPSLEHLSGQAGAPFRATPELAHIGWETGQALGLDIFGVGIVVGPTGPHVVDVNPFPGFRGVPEAADLIACRLAGIALGKPASCTCADEVTATVAMPAGQATFRLVQG